MPIRNRQPAGSRLAGYAPYAWVRMLSCEIEGPGCDSTPHKLKSFGLANWSLAGGRHWAPKMGQALTHATCLASTSPAPPFRPTTGAASPSVPSSARPMRAGREGDDQRIGNRRRDFRLGDVEHRRSMGVETLADKRRGSQHHGHGRTTSFPLTTKSNRSWHRKQRNRSLTSGTSPWPAEIIKARSRGQWPLD